MEKSAEEIAEEITKESYFDMTTHPAENPPLGKFMDEYVGHIGKRITMALKEAKLEGARGCAAEVLQIRCIGEYECGDYFADAANDYVKTLEHHHHMVNGVFECGCVPEKE